MAVGEPGGGIVPQWSGNFTQGSWRPCGEMLGEVQFVAFLYDMH